ncbi:MAG: hypothetical protein WCX65_20295 [bacterium]
MATTQGKKHALEQLAKRRKENQERTQINNALQPAGSPMHYECKGCGADIVLPELHSCAVPPLCDECQAMKDCGWLE